MKRRPNPEIRNGGVGSVVHPFSERARKIGIWSAIAVVILGATYAIALAAGLLSLPSPDQPIGDPIFSILEILIILMMLPMVALMAVVHDWAPSEAKALTLTALVFMSLTAAVTCSVHFVILTVSHQAAFRALSWMPLFFTYRWPSVVYALDILAWDVFFPFSMLFAAPAFSGNKLTLRIRWLLIASGGLALAGLAGVAFSNMQVRDVGIVGYAVVFPIAAAFLFILFRRAASGLK